VLHGRVFGLCSLFSFIFGGVVVMGEGGIFYFVVIDVGWVRKCMWCWGFGVGIRKGILLV